MLNFYTVYSNINPLLRRRKIKGDNGQFYTKNGISQSANSLDYEEISRETYGSLKRSSLYVKSIANELNQFGLPKAVWQFGDKSHNIYNDHSPSEMGFKTNNEGNLRKYYLTQTGSQLSLNTSFADTEFSGATFDDEIESGRSPQRTCSGVSAVFQIPTHIVKSGM